MRQGFVVTCFLGLFVAVAMLFTGGASLFAMPEAPVGAVAEQKWRGRPARRTAGDPDAAPRHPVVGGGRNLRRAALDFRGLRPGRFRQGLRRRARVCRRRKARPDQVEDYVPFRGRPSSSAPASGATLTSVVEPYAAGGVAEQVPSFTPVGVPPAGAAPADWPAYDRAAQDSADFERFSVAAGGGDLNAEYRLGMLYRDGRGVDRDPAAAAHWLLASAKGGDPLAAIAIAEMYEAGASVERDPVAAYAWLDIAAARSPDPSDRAFALKERDRVGAALTRAQLDRARRLANGRKWVALADSRSVIRSQ